MESPYQILPGRGVDGSLPADRGIDHGKQGSGHLNDRNSAHEGGGDEAREVPHDSAAKRDHCCVSAVPFGEHLVGEPAPDFPGFVGLTGGDGEGIYRVRIELRRDLFRVERADVRVGDQGVPMCWSECAREGPEVR
jgi:hypothetical protein